ncbi:MAG: hypothetical protein QM765_11635 [Myxococcales bacterium]
MALTPNIKHHVFSPDELLKLADDLTKPTALTELAVLVGCLFYRLGHRPPGARQPGAAGLDLVRPAHHRRRLLPGAGRAAGPGRARAAGR